MIDVSLVQGLGHQGRIAPEGGSRIFFFSGRRTIEKGSYVLVRAFKKFSDRCRCDARLVLVGDPPVCRELREVKEKLIFVRQRPYPDYLRLMSSVDVVLVPSQIEPFGLVVLEALSLGKAIVASNTGGIREIVDGLGALVEPGDEEELAEAMEEACKGSLGEERERYVERAWEFDVSRIAPLLYDDILRNGSVDLGR
ncbi:MAG: glycosyltransferase [Candidatus Korarchaeum sp.]